MFRRFGRPLRDPGRSTPELVIIIEKKYKDDDYINGRFIKEVQHYDYLVRQNSNQYAVLQVVLITISALTSFFVGLEAIIASSNIFKLLALLLSLFVAILANYMTTFNLQAKWGAYRFVRESLTTEFYRFYTGVEPYTASEDRTNDRRLFATNVEKLIENANKSWGGLNAIGNQPR